MKNILKLFAAVLFVGAMVPAAMTSCTDMDGDGVDSVLWEGSKNPQNTSFRNPVWEPSLEAGTLLKGASMYVAISATTQWAPGLTYYCPAVTSNDLMSWSKASTDAFSETTTPQWATGRVNSLSADFAKTYSGNKYWMVYSIEGENSIGCASATSPQGLYTDLGKLELKTNTSTVKDPYFLVQAKNYYVCYSTEEGTYMQKVGLSKTGMTIGAAATPIKVTGAEFTDVAIVAFSASNVYIFGVVNNEIRYARASSVTGPFLDKSGTSLADGSTGEALISASSEYGTVENPMRAFLNSEGDYMYLAYNAVQSDMATMQSGYPRKPLFVQPLAVGEDGWFTATYTPAKGWTAPRFE